MLITSLDFSAFTVSYRLRVLLEGMPIISKRDGTITKSRIKELHFEGLGQKKQEVTAGDIYVLLSGRF
jgi:hypothetical protein